MPGVRPSGPQPAKVRQKKQLGKTGGARRRPSNPPDQPRPIGSQGKPTPPKAEKPSDSIQSLVDQFKKLYPQAPETPPSTPGKTPPSDPEDGAPTPPSAPPESTPPNFNDPFNPPQMWCPPANWTPPKPEDPFKIDPEMLKRIQENPIDWNDFDPLKPPKDLPPGTLWC